MTTPIRCSGRPPALVARPAPADRARGAWSPRRSTSSARWPASSSGRCCCSPAARTRSSCCTWRAKAFWPAPVPFALLHVDTGHNFPEVLAYRDEAVERYGAAAAGRRTCRTTSTTAGCASAPTARATRCRPCRCSTRSPTTDSTPSSAAAAATRRRPGPRSGSSAARRVRPVGPAQPAPRAVEPVQRPAPARRARAGVPAVQLDRARRLALHRAREDRAAVDLLRPRARGVPARRHVARDPRRLGRPGATARRRGRARSATARSATCPAPAR